MKNTLLILLLIFPAFIHAQEVDSLSVYKPVAGDKTIELQFKPFGDNPISINGVRARWFKTPQNAFRLNIFMGIDADTDITQQENSDQNLKELKDKSLLLGINVRPGMEKHLKGTERLSPYFGWEADIAVQYSSFKSENQNGDLVNYTKSINNNGFIRLGANLIAGMDFYVAKKFYLGAELGFGASFTNLMPVKLKSDIDGFQEPDPQRRGSSIDFGPNVNAQIRLGYAF